MIPVIDAHAGRWGRSDPVTQTGRPLPGRTPHQVVSQLIYRVLGPYPDDVRPVLDLHGMAGRPAALKKDTAARNNMPVLALRRLHEQVIGEARRVPLDPAITARAAARSGPFDDHQARRVIAETLGVQRPEPWAATMADSWAVHTCLNALAALGPQPLQVLLSVVQRSRRGKNIPPLPAAHLAFLLALHSQDVDRRPDGRWQVHSDRRPPQRHQRLVAAMGNRVFTRQGIAQVLIGLGYAASSATGQTLDRHPMIAHIGPDQYALASLTGSL